MKWQWNTPRDGIYKIKTDPLPASPWRGRGGFLWTDNNRKDTMHRVSTNKHKNNNIMKTHIKTIAALITMPAFGRVPDIITRGLKTCTMLCITITLLTLNFSTLSAQTPPPPNGGNTPAQGDNTPVGGGAPIGGGLLILVALGAGYGAKKVYQMKKRNLAE